MGDNAEHLGEAFLGRMDEAMARHISDPIKAGTDIQSVARICGVTQDDVWDAVGIVANLDYPVGTRVRLLDWRIGVTLRSDLGTVVGPLDAGGGYILVRLDQPAIRRSVDGTVDDLETIVELAHPDNVERVEGDTA